MPASVQVDISDTHKARAEPDLVHDIEQQHDRKRKIRLEEVVRLVAGGERAGRARRVDGDPELRDEDEQEGDEADPGPSCAERRLVDEVGQGVALGAARRRGSGCARSRCWPR